MTYLVLYLYEIITSIDCLPEGVPNSVPKINVIVVIKIHQVAEVEKFVAQLKDIFH